VIQHNYVRGLWLRACEVAGHTTFVGCHIDGLVKIESGATLEMVGCTVVGSFPNSVRVGKQATLRVTDSEFRTAQTSWRLNEHIKTPYLGASEISLQDCRFTGDTFNDISIESTTMQTLRVERCTFEFVKRSEARSDDQFPVTADAMRFMCKVPPNLILKDNHFIDRRLSISGLRINAGSLQRILIEGSRFEKRLPILWRDCDAFVHLDANVQVKAKDSVLVNVPANFKLMRTNSDSSVIVEDNTRHEPTTKATDADNVVVSCIRGHALSFTGTGTGSFLGGRRR
jgi:hypothetical protein